MRNEFIASVTRAPLVLAVAAAVALSGCATVKQTVGGWFGESVETPDGTGSAGQVYYAAVERLTMHAEPSASSKVVGHLALHERVTRTRLERGYAYVTTDRDGLAGWVDNAQLAWRLPAGGARPADKAEAAAPETAPPSRGEADAAAAKDDATPTPTSTPEGEAAPAPPAVASGESAPPTPTAKAGGAEPSMFDPY
jgi:hypothetical protein